MGTFIFIVAFAVSVAIIAIFLLEIKEDRKVVKASEAVTNIRCIARGMTVFLAIIAITDKSGLINFGIYSGSYFLMGTVCTMAYILCAISRKSNLSLIVHSLKVILVAFILELTIFNIPVYDMWIGKYKTTTYQIDSSMLDRGGEYRESEKDIVVRNGEELVFKIPEINQTVSTVYVDLDFENGTKAVDFSIDATDDTQSYVKRDNIARTIISNKQPVSHYLQCRLSGQTSEIAVHIKPQNYGTAYVNSITLNMPIPMEVSWIRFLLIVILSIFIHSVMNTRIMQESITEKRKLCRNVTVILTTLMCLFAMWVTNYRLEDRTWKEEFSKTTGNQVTQQLVDAFEDKRTYLYPEPDDNLKNFDNPYDRQHRDAELVTDWDSSWDHVYFDGKFYSYYGIAPVILLFLPYHLITDYYFSDTAAVLIFSLIGIIGLSFLFVKLTKKFFPELPTGIFIISLIIIQVTSGIWYSIGRPSFYEIAMSAGFAFMTWAFYFLISANIIGNGKVSLPKTAISSLLFALAVLSRPTTVLYCICAAVFMVCAVKKFKDNNQKLLNRKSIGYLSCAIVPMACLGIVQMIYNYVRFKSPFEFGIQYSLTINDFRNTQFHWQLSMIPLWNYLFNPPVFSTTHPFISAKFQDMNVGGFFYSDHLATHNVCGLFFLALTMFAYVLSGKALKTIPDHRERTKTLLYILFPCVVIPLIIICSVWESGYAIRYMADFAWHMLIGAYAVIFCLYLKTTNKTFKKIITIFFCISLVWAVIVNGVMFINQAFRYSEYHWDFPEMAYELEKIFMFWK